LTAKRPEISLQTTDQFVTIMFETDADFVVYSHARFRALLPYPVLILPDAHRPQSAAAGRHSKLAERPIGSPAEQRLWPTRIRRPHIDSGPRLVHPPACTRASVSMSITWRGASSPARRTHDAAAHPTVSPGNTTDR
jgi:hypothetical protein